MSEWHNNILFKVMSGIFVVSVVTQAKTVMQNTAIECDVDQTFTDLFEVARARPQSTELQKINYDNITCIKIKEHPKDDASSIEMAPGMTLKSCQDFHCKYVEFRVSGITDPVPAHSTPDPRRPNAFSIMMAAQNTLLLPPKPPQNKDKITGPQRLYSDLIDWASNFDNGWTVDVLETGKRTDMGHFYDRAHTSSTWIHFAVSHST